MMTIEKIYRMSIEMGILNGPRARKDILEQFAEAKKKFAKLSAKEKPYFDLDRLDNPFLDTRINYGDKKMKVKRVLVGIDIGVEDLLMAKELERMGKKIDVVIAHHPEGRALVDLDQVMDLSHDLSVGAGVPINVAEKISVERRAQVNRSIHNANAYKVVDAAKLLDLPLMTLHTVADNQCYAYFKKFIDARKPRKVGDIIDALMEMPEFQEAKKKGMGPKIVLGSEKSSTGKICYFGLTGGTNGAKEIYEHLSRAGVGTLVDMHIPEDHRKEAQKHHLNVVQATHMASDSVGMNLLLDEMEKNGVEIVACSGFTRVSRVKNKKK